MITHTSDIVTIWPATGTPERMVWEGRRFRVSDTPTPIHGEFWDEALTHPGRNVLLGWRFQGTDEGGQSHVFDIRWIPGGWELTSVYD